MNFFERLGKWLDSSIVIELKKELEELRKENHELIGINLGLKEAAETVLKGKCPKCDYRLGDKK